MKIRFLSAVEPGWTYYRDILPALAEAGASVEIVISEAEYRGGRLPLSQLVGDRTINVRTVPTPRPRGRGLPTALLYGWYCVIAAFYTLFGQKADLNVFLTQPPFFYCWGAALKAVRGQAYAVVVMDIYPDVAMRAHYLSTGGWLGRLLQRLSRYALRRADKVIVIGRCMQELLIRDGVAKSKMHLIPNWVDERQIYPVGGTENQLKAEIGIAEQDFVVLYSGNHGQVHSFDAILRVAKRLQNESRIKFLFVGEGVRKGEVEAAKWKDNLDNILLIPFQPVSRLAESLSLADVHFISLRSGFEGLVVPSKIYGALATGRLVVYEGESHGEVARLINEEGIGIVIPPGDHDALEAAILAYFRDDSRRKKEGDRALAVSKGLVSRQRALDQYRAALFGERSSACEQAAVQGPNF